MIDKIFLCSFLLFISAYSKAELSAEAMLQKVIEVYEIHSCNPIDKTDFTDLGRRLFESKELSGDYDTSCSDCHLRDKALADGLALAIGTGGHGVGLERLNSEGAIVPRNALTLFGRGRKEFPAFFWDGKVDSNGQNMFSPFGDEISTKFNSALAVASTLPIAERDELLGADNLINSNDLLIAAEDLFYQDKYEALSKALADRTRDSAILQELALRLELDENESLELADIGNALADFISVEFGCRDSAWEQYLLGDRLALSERAIEGAVLFFGKSRCSGCHTPPLFSDFKYHSIGIPQGDIGPHSRNRDIGRAAVSNKGEDLFKFRTPPLIAVSETAPYGHNGRFTTLESIVTHHINPVATYLKAPFDMYSKDYFEAGKQLASRSSRLRYVEITTESELMTIVEFLNAL